MRVKGIRSFLFPRKYLLDLRGKTGRKDGNFVPYLEYATGNPTGKAPEVMMLVRMRSDDPLDRKTRIHVIGIRSDVDVLKVVKQAGGAWEITR